MESYDVKNNSSVVTLCNKKDVGTMKKKNKRERERNKEATFIISVPSFVWYSC